MKLTEFGKAVRKARIDAEVTLMSMADDLKTTPAFLSGIETGRKQIPQDWVSKIYNFFAGRGVMLDELQEKAYLANKSIPIDRLDHEHQCLIAGFAKTDLTKEEMQEFAELLKKIKNR